jgi:hypothetical protein
MVQARSVGSIWVPVAERRRRKEEAEGRRLRPLRVVEKEVRLSDGTVRVLPVTICPTVWAYGVEMQRSHGGCNEGIPSAFRNLRVKGAP